MNRRNFLKLIGLAAVTPVSAITNIAEPKKKEYTLGNASISINGEVIPIRPQTFRFVPGKDDKLVWTLPTTVHEIPINVKFEG